MALRVVSILIQMRIHAPPQKQPEEHDTDTRSQLRCLAASSPYVWTVAFGTLWALTTSFFGPFFMRFMIEGLEMQANEINRLIIISNVTGALSLPAIGHLIDRHGGRAVLMFSMVATLVPSMTWCLATPDRNGFLVWLWVSGGIWNAAILLAQFNLLLKVVPVGAKTLAVSLNVALSALASAMAPIAGGAALEHLRASGVSALNAYQILALIHHILPLSCLLVLRRIQEPKSTSFNELFGAMRSGRTIAALLGATFLQNYILVRRRRRGGD
jgi:predicted MFS family arabinose efflux permease